MQFCIDLLKKFCYMTFVRIDKIKQSKQQAAYVPLEHEDGYNDSDDDDQRRYSRSNDGNVVCRWRDCITERFYLYRKYLDLTNIVSVANLLLTRFVQQ